jgi:GTPase SAR1 family protein
MLADFLRLISGFVLFIGPTEAGKTSILRRLVTGKFSDQLPTLGFREERISKVRVVEIGGQEDFRKYWEIALEKNPVHTFFVIDAAKDHDWDEYHKYKEKLPEFTLIANKKDLLKSPSIHSSDKEIGILSSAKTGEGMYDILEAIANLRKKAEVSYSPIPLKKSK